MKIRIKGNTVRLRLTQSELNDFGEKGLVEEKTIFAPGNELTYSIKMADCKQLQCSFIHNKIIISVPQNSASAWVATDLVGLDNFDEAKADSDLKILVEKDFACLDARESEDESDMFPHPNDKNLNC